MRLYRVRVIAAKVQKGGRKHWGHGLELVAESEAEAIAKVQKKINDDAHPWGYRIVDAIDLGDALSIRDAGQFTMEKREFNQRFGGAA